MLEIKKGKSSQSYENEFFRQFSYTLSQLFEMNNWKGLLLGMPNCITREDLQIDALLITDNSTPANANVGFYIFMEEG